VRVIGVGVVDPRSLAPTSGCWRCVWDVTGGGRCALDPRRPSGTPTGVGRGQVGGSRPIETGSIGRWSNGPGLDGPGLDRLVLDGPASVVPGAGGVCAGPGGLELVYADGFHLPLIVPCACVPGDDEFLARWADEPWCVDTLPGPLGRAGGRAGPLGRPVGGRCVEGTRGAGFRRRRSCSPAVSGTPARCIPQGGDVTWGGRCARPLATLWDADRCRSWRGRGVAARDGGCARGVCVGGVG
jgi:hypothetical protein